MKEKIVIFGAGKNGKLAVDDLHNEKDVVAIVDNNESLWGSTYNGIKIVSPSKLRELQYDEIIIASAYRREILDQLQREYGIKKCKLFIQRSEQLAKYEIKDVYTGILFAEMKEDVTKDIKKNILMIAYYFPPLGASPIQRTLKFVKYLSEMGYGITVLTVSDTNGKVLDESLISEVPEEVNVIRIEDDYVVAEGLNYSEQKQIYNFLRFTLPDIDMKNILLNAQISQKNYVIPDALVLWGAKAWEKIEDVINLSNIDIIYSTVPEWTPHILAYNIKKKYGIPWIADYRDPWVASYDYIKAVYPLMTDKEVEFDRVLESKLISRMDAIIMAGESWKELYKKTYSVDESVMYVIPNGYDETDFECLSVRDRKNQFFTLCYNGELGYNRKPRNVIEVISDLIDEDIVDKNKIRWIFNGFISPKMYEDEIDKYDKHKICIHNGSLPHIESLQYAYDADMMVMYGEIGDMARLNYPAKFYEYLRLGRPILCCSQSGSPQEKILNEFYMGKNFDLNDKEGIRDYILNTYKTWRESDNILPTSRNGIERYNRRVLTEKLATIIERL